MDDALLAGQFRHALIHSNRQRAFAIRVPDFAGAVPRLDLQDFLDGPCQRLLLPFLNSDLHPGNRIGHRLERNRAFIDLEVEAIAVVMDFGGGREGQRGGAGAGEVHVKLAGSGLEPTCDHVPFRDVLVMAVCGTGREANRQHDRDCKPTARVVRLRHSQAPMWEERFWRSAPLSSTHRRRRETSRASRRPYAFGGPSRPSARFDDGHVP